MSRLQRWMAAWACVGMLIGPAGECWAAPAAGSDAGSATASGGEHLNLAFIPADAVSAIVAHPQPFLKGPEADWLPVEVITAAGMKEAGFDPLKVREGIALFAPPAQGPSPDIGFILRFSESYSKDSVKAAMRGRQINVAGREVIEVPGPQSFLWTFPDDKTSVGGTAGMLKKMLDAEKADSPLIGLLKSVDTSGHLTAAFSIDAVRPIMKRAIAAAPPVPAMFQGVLRIPDLLSAMILKVDAGATFKASLTLRAIDDDSAAAIESMVNGGLAFGRQMALAEVANMPNRGNDPVESAGAKYVARITNKLFDLIKPVRKGKEVSVTVEVGSGMTVLPVLIGLMLPAMQAARFSARRVQSSNNVRQIQLAMLNHEAAFKKFPDRTIRDKNGKPLLSWRVKILPFIEQKNLFDQFHLDEPWDSEHNKELIAMMPAIYRNPDRAEIDNKTNYLLPVGKGTMWEGDEGLKIQQITDGTSNTLMIVEANEDKAVIWTKPDDLDVDMDHPKEGLGDFRDMILVGFCDGSIRMLSKSISNENLRALFTYRGGEVVNTSEF
jgi:hypothetical protein